MCDTSKIIVRIGPTFSLSASEIRRTYNAYLVSGQCEEGCDEYQFDEADNERAEHLLHLVSRVRNVVVVWKGQSYTRGEYLRARYEEQSNGEEEEFWREYEKAGSTWPAPDAEFLELAEACAQGGEWEGVEEGRPLPPESRKALITIFAGRGFSPNGILEQAMSLLPEQLTPVDWYAWQKESSEKLGLPLYQVKEVLGYVSHLGANLAILKSALKKNRLVFVQVFSDAPSITKRLYLNEDRKSPRLFRPEELPPAGFNADRELVDWLPTIPPLHLGCCCTLCSWPGFWVKEDGSIDRHSPNYLTRLPSFDVEVIE